MKRRSAISGSTASAPPEGKVTTLWIQTANFFISAQGVPDPVGLEMGDCFVLPSGRPSRLASDLTLAPIASKTVFPPARTGGVVSYIGGGDFFIVGSRYELHSCGRIVGNAAADCAHPTGIDQASLHWSEEQMIQVLRERQPGGLLEAQHLAHMMLVQALRLHLAEGPRSGVGRFFALADEHTSAATNAMHDDPAHRWTLQELGSVPACLARPLL
ncbi:cupin domain-containing protein [Mesorhizobium sp. 43Arga]